MKTFIPKYLFLFSYFDYVKYADVVFPASKPFNDDAIKSLTRENLELKEEQLQGFQKTPKDCMKMPNFSTTTTDSDYLSTVQTETTTFMNNYKILDEDNINEYVTLLGASESSVSDPEQRLAEDIARLGPVTTKHLLVWAYQVAKGMEYLGSKKILHGDLALRNILLSENNIIKICDFGLSKNLYSSLNYQKLSDSPLPVKWLALETLNFR